MRIQKRNGDYEPLSFDKVRRRINNLAVDRQLGEINGIDCDIVSQKVIQQIIDGISSKELDVLAADIATAMSADNPGYGELASRIAVSNLQKSTPDTFSKCVKILFDAKVVNKEFATNVHKNAKALNGYIVNSRDYLFDHFGISTLDKGGYLLNKLGKDTKTIIERPQYMWMRVAVALHKTDLPKIYETYTHLSLKNFIHASPTLFNAGTNKEQLSSCFAEDTIVTTINKGPVEIKDIEIDDLVVTHLGNVKKVSQLHKNLLLDREFYQLDVFKSVPVKVTGNHKVWAMSVQESEIKSRKDRVLYDVNFVKNYLIERDLVLVSDTYQNIKKKLDIRCVKCDAITNMSFEVVMYSHQGCSSKKCSDIKRNLSRLKNLDDKLSAPGWVTVEDLRPGDFVCIPNKKYEVDYDAKIDLYDYKDILETNDRLVDYKISYDEDNIVCETLYTHDNFGFNTTASVKHNSINRVWNIDENLAMFVGIFYGDGHIMKSKDSNGNEVIRGVGITIHSKNSKLVEYCSSIGRNIFGIEPVFHNMKDQNITQVLFNSMMIGTLFKHLFGSGFNGKRVWSEMYKWDKFLVEKLLHGLVTTDGCITSQKTVMLQMSNVDFMRDLYYLFRNNSIDCSYGKEKIQKNATKYHVNMNIPFEILDSEYIFKTYEDDRMLKIKTKRNFSEVYERDGFKFLRIRSKTLLDERPEFVYNIGVDDDNSYNPGGLVAKNCFLLDTEDSVEGIFNTMAKVAQVSKHGGGIGLTCTRIRAKGSIIRGTNNRSDGIMPMLKVYNEVSRYINQGQRKGSIAVFLEPHHADIEIFLEMRKNTGDVNLRARDLFYGLWVSDLFMKRVEADGDWYLMCPDECPGLVDAFGENYEELYNGYVEKGMYRKKLPAREIWNAILVSQTETGTPYICYKDAVNTKNNQANLGTISSSNLCCEIVLKHTNDEYAVCNISSLCLGNCVINGEFDFDLLGKLTRIAVVNLNKVIDTNYYPTPETEKSNVNHRPIAIGVQGLYDAFVKLSLPFTSNGAKELNKKIFECIQFNALSASCELAVTDGTYSSFAGSPSSKGLFQHNLWGLDEAKLNYDWADLRKKVMAHGLRNSMLTALPPTASTANIMGNTSSFETVTSNLFTRTVIAGTFQIVNKYLVNDLIKLNLWSPEMKDSIILANGSIQGVANIPKDIKELYKTTWETSQKDTITMSADRAPFVDHSQSLNIFMANPTISRLSSMHFYGWKKGLKTGMYYLRSQPISTAEKISVSTNTQQQQVEALSCSIDNKDACVMCEG